MSGELEARIAEAAARALRGGRRPLLPLVQAVLELLVLEALEADERFAERGALWGLAASDVQDELERRRAEEELARNADEGPRPHPSLTTYGTEEWPEPAGAIPPAA